MRNYRLRINTLSKFRIDELTAMLHQYDEYLAAVAAGDRRAGYSKRRLEVIEAAALACGCHDDLIAVCCRKSPPPGSPKFSRARRAFYLMLSETL